MKKNKMTPNEAAEYLGVSKALIHKRIRQGRYKGVKQCECGFSFLIPVRQLRRKITRIERRPEVALDQKEE